MVAFTAPIVCVVGNVTDCKVFGLEQVHAACSNIGKGMGLYVSMERINAMLCTQ